MRRVSSRGGPKKLRGVWPKVRTACFSVVGPPQGRPTLKSKGRPPPPPRKCPKWVLPTTPPVQRGIGTHSRVASFGPRPAQLAARHATFQHNLHCGPPNAASRWPCCHSLWKKQQQQQNLIQVLPPIKRGHIASVVFLWQVLRRFSLFLCAFEGHRSIKVHIAHNHICFFVFRVAQMENLFLYDSRNCVCPCEFCFVRVPDHFYQCEPRRRMSDCKAKPFPLLLGGPHSHPLLSSLVEYKISSLLSAW